MQILSELLKYRGVIRTHNPGQQWAEISDAELTNLLPFWNREEIQEVCDSLRNLGMIFLERKASGEGCWIAVDDSAIREMGHWQQKSGIQQANGSGANAAVGLDVRPTAKPNPKPNARPERSPEVEADARPNASQNAGPEAEPDLDQVVRLGAGSGASITSLADGNHAKSLIPAGWIPDANWIRLCEQQAVPQEFARSQIPRFVAYWQERGEAKFSWGNAFYKHVLREWRQEQTRLGSNELASPMSPDWQPCQDAVDILVRAGISLSFIEDAVPEFVLYWRERGAAHGAWNTRFIDHIRRQWAKFTASYGVDDTPRPISKDWQPGEDCIEILHMAEIDEEYARSKVPEFVMYWSDRNQARPSWNTVFLQFIKMDWARRLHDGQAANSLAGDNLNAENQTIAGSAAEKVRARLEQLADRSWANQ